MRHFFDQTPETLSKYCAEHGMQRYVGGQLLEWVYQKGVVDPQQMTNISQRNREVIRDTIQFYTGGVIRHQIATDATQKLLIDWSGTDAAARAATSSTGVQSDHVAHSSAGGLSAAEIDARRNDAAVRRSSSSLPLPLMASQDIGDPNKQTECVMIPTESRRTACISSQVGCPVGCRFCASGLGGLDGNLRAGQIVEQVHRLSFQSSEIRDQRSEVQSRVPTQSLTSDLRPLTSSVERRITNVVFMGMGEPLANFTNVTNAIRTLNAPWGMNISARKITVSTVGLPAAIRKLVNFELPVTLALSLHAPNDELRRQLIPWAEYATIAELLDACDEYFQKTGREITLEYLLLRNVNDRMEHARQLASLAKRLRANVNLIRYNEVKGLPFDRPTTEDVHAFQEVLRRQHVNAHLRASRGRDIAAACGQLRHEHRARAAG